MSGGSDMELELSARTRLRATRETNKRSNCRGKPGDKGDRCRQGRGRGQ